MLKNLTPLLALGTFAVVVVFLGSVLWKSLFPHEVKEQGSQSESQQAEQNYPYKQLGGGGQSKDTADEAVAEYTKWLAIFTALLVLVSAFQIGFLISADKSATKSAESAKKSADVARDTLVSTQRPWVKISSFSTEGLAFDVQGAKIALSLVVKNVGPAPAINVRMFATMRGKPLFELKDQVRECEAVKKWVGKGGPVVFPGDETKLNYVLSISAANLKEYGIDVPDKGRSILPVIYGCVDYTLWLDETHHQTGFAYNVGQIKDGKVAVIYPAAGDIPPDRLSFVPYIAGGFFAD